MEQPVSNPTSDGTYYIPDKYKDKVQAPVSDEKPIVDSPELETLTITSEDNYPSWISWILLLLPLIASAALLGLNLYYYFTDQTNYTNVANGTVILWVSLGLFILSLIAVIISLVPYFYQYSWITFLRIASMILAFTPIPGLVYNLYSYFNPPSK